MPLTVAIPFTTWEHGTSTPTWRTRTPPGEDSGWWNKEWDFEAQLSPFTVEGFAGANAAITLAEFIVDADNFTMEGEVVIPDETFVCLGLGEGIEQRGDITLPSAMFLFRIEGSTGSETALTAPAFTCEAELVSDCPMEGEVLFQPLFSASANGGYVGALQLASFACAGDSLGDGKATAVLTSPRAKVSGEMIEDAVFSGAISLAPYLVAGRMDRDNIIEGEVTTSAFRVRGLMERQAILDAEADLILAGFLVDGSMIPGDQQDIEADIVLRPFRAAGFMRNQSTTFAWYDSRTVSSTALTQPNLTGVPVMRYSR